jgi:hypothetical protein
MSGAHLVIFFKCQKIGRWDSILCKNLGLGGFIGNSWRCSQEKISFLALKKVVLSFMALFQNEFCFVLCPFR